MSHRPILLICLLTLWFVQPAGALDIQRSYLGNASCLSCHTEALAVLPACSCLGCHQGNMDFLLAHGYAGPQAAWPRFVAAAGVSVLFVTVGLGMVLLRRRRELSLVALLALTLTGLGWFGDDRDEVAVERWGKSVAEGYTSRPRGDHLSAGRRVAVRHPGTRHHGRRSRGHPRRPGAVPAAP